MPRALSTLQSNFNVMNKIEGNDLTLVVCHLPENKVVAFYDILNSFIGNQLKYLKVFENYFFT